MESDEQLSERMQRNAEESILSAETVDRLDEIERMLVDPARKLRSYQIDILRAMISGRRPVLMSLPPGYGKDKSENSELSIDVDGLNEFIDSLDLETSPISSDVIFVRALLNTRIFTAKRLAKVIKNCDRLTAVIARLEAAVSHVPAEQSPAERSFEHFETEIRNATTLQKLGYLHKLIVDRHNLLFPSQRGRLLVEIERRKTAVAQGGGNGV